MKPLEQFIEQDVEQTCAFCNAKAQFTIRYPAGWAIKDGEFVELNEGTVFCPKHAKAQEFFDAQCPGCVAGWPDCPFFNAIAHPGDPLDEKDFNRIRSGFCPRRVNGTTVFGPAGMESIDLSEPAPQDAAEAIATGVEQYLKLYGEK